MDTTELICSDHSLLPEEYPPIPWTETGQLFRWGRRPEIIMVLLDKKRYDDGEYTYDDLDDMAGQEDAHFMVYVGWDASFGGHIYHMGGICFCASEFAPASMVDSGELELVEGSWPSWRTRIVSETTIAAAEGE